MRLIRVLINAEVRNFINKTKRQDMGKWHILQHLIFNKT